MAATRRARRSFSGSACSMPYASASAPTRRPPGCIASSASTALASDARAKSPRSLRSAMKSSSGVSGPTCRSRSFQAGHASASAWVPFPLPACARRASTAATRRAAAARSADAASGARSACRAVAATSQAPSRPVRPSRARKSATSPTAPPLRPPASPSRSTSSRAAASPARRCASSAASTALST